MISMIAIADIAAATPDLEMEAASLEALAEGETVWLEEPYGTIDPDKPNWVHVRVRGTPEHVLVLLEVEDLQQDVGNPDTYYEVRLA